MAPLRIMLVAAEPSGDGLGAGLMRALRARLGKDVSFIGVGGPLMKAEGLDSLFDISDLAIWGWAEGVKAWPRAVKRAEQTATLASQKPDAAVLIDSWGFTLRVGQRLRKRDPKMLLIKYVGPQVWASRPGRAKTLAKTFDHLLSILSFDAPYFERYGLPVTKVGNPHLMRSFEDAHPERARKRIGADRDDQILLILPGSRLSEVQRLMPPFGEAAALLKANRPGLQIVVVVAPSVAEAVRAEAAKWPYAPHFIEGESAKQDAMKAATVALACSGSVTTELALAGAPMVVAYKVSPLSAILIRMMIKTKFITLLNIAVGRAIAPEFIQSRCTPGALAKALAARLDDPRLRAQQIADQNSALALMAPKEGPDPSERAAEAVLALIRRKQLKP